ncbi:MAG: TOBE domain-containing protein, partial [Pseudaminobacter sp.]
VTLEATGFSPGDMALLGVRPQYLQRDADDAAGRVRGNVSLVERLGAETIVSFETVSNEQALVAIPHDEEFEAGSSVEFSFNPRVAHLFAAA